MVIHVVQKGDSVYTIARRYGVPMERLVSDNGLSDPARLTPGQALLIRQPKLVYMVQPGDTLGEIAARYTTTVMRLWQMNPRLNGGEYIEPGWQIIVGEQGKQGTLAVNGYAYPAVDETILRRTLPYLTYLSVFSFGAGADGTLALLEDKGLPQLARQYKALPLAVLTTLGPDGMFSSERAHALLGNPQAQEKLADALVTMLRARGYGGVDVDFEYLPPEDGERYTAFIRMLREKLSQYGLIVVVSLAPKTSEAQKGLLYEAHRYPMLGAAADLAIVMAYEWGYAYSEPMAVAPLNKVRPVMEYAASVIPPEKLLMGMPNYGYDWPLPYCKDETRARTLGNLEAVQQAIDVGAFIEYDQTAEAPHYSYWKAKTAHEVWFEDARSVKASLALVRSLSLAGVSVWNIMRWFPQLWLVLEEDFRIRKLL